MDAVVSKIKQGKPNQEVEVLKKKVSDVLSKLREEIAQSLTYYDAIAVYKETHHSIQEKFYTYRCFGSAIDRARRECEGKKPNLGNAKDILYAPELRDVMGSFSTEFPLPESNIMNLLGTEDYSTLRSCLDDINGATAFIEKLYVEEESTLTVERIEDWRDRMRTLEKKWNEALRIADKGIVLAIERLKKLLRTTSADE